MSDSDGWRFIVRERGAAPLYFAGVAMPPLFAFRYTVTRAAATRFLDAGLARGAAAEMSARMPGTRWEVLAVRAKRTVQPPLDATPYAYRLTGPLT